MCCTCRQEASVVTGNTCAGSALSGIDSDIIYAVVLQTHELIRRGEGQFGRASTNFRIIHPSLLHRMFNFGVKMLQKRSQWHWGELICEVH